MTYRLLLSLLLFGLIAGCDTTDVSTHRPEPVVEAYLVGGAVFPSVRLSMTEDVDAVYDADALGIVDASVRIDRLDEAGAIAETVQYRHADGQRGVYEPATQAIVATSTRYRLEATLADGAQVTSETFVPGEFDILRESNTAIVYRNAADEQFSVDVTRSAYPGRQAVYLITLEAQEPTIENLTPFYLDAVCGLDPGDPLSGADCDESDLEDFYQASSPPINEASWDEGPNDSVILKLPWFAVVFYGPTRVEFNALDDNINDFFRFQNAQAGGSTLSPGELPNILDAVEGGTGVFGSMARQEILIDVLRQ